MVTDIGCGSGDFIDNIIADFGESVTHIPVTVTEDVRGNEVRVFSGTTTITAHVLVRSIDYVRDKTGIQKLAPAYMQSKDSDGVKAGDMIIVSVGTFKVFNTIAREAAQSGLYVYSELYYWE
jgi:hypothetical protein